MLAALVGLIGLLGFFTAAEFALAAARKEAVEQLAPAPPSELRSPFALWKMPGLKRDLITLAQVGGLFSLLLLGWITYHVVTVWAQPVAAWASGSLAQAPFVGVALVSLVVLFAVMLAFSVLGELMPKSAAMQHPNETMLLAFLPMRLALGAAWPFIWLLQTAVSGLLRLLPGVDDPQHVRSTEDLEQLVTESHEQGMLDDQARLMLRNTFRLRELVARHVMVHRTKLVAAPLNTDVLTILELAIDAGFTRIPLYERNVDEIVGFVHVKDLYRLHLQDSADIASILREVLFVPETMPALKVWERLNTRRKYLAIVFDEFGGTAGLITFEDLIEEVFGELQDEFDNEMALVSVDKAGRVHLRGDLLVSDVNEYLDLNLPEDVADTLGGLVFSELGTPPEVGTVLEIAGVSLRVEQAEDLGVQEVSLLLQDVASVTAYSEWEVADYDE